MTTYQTLEQVRTFTIINISAYNSLLFISFLSNPFDKTGVPGYETDEWKKFYV